MLGALLGLAGSASAQTNQLLRSGTIAQFADTKIYQATGIEISVGEANNSFFRDSEDLAASLTSAAQATGVIEQGWQTTSSFEEWTDRLILTRTTTYTLLDGAAFQANHVNGDPFVPSQDIVNDQSPAPDMVQLATDFIAADGHLDLYPAAQAAGNIGPQALLDELGNDVGLVTFTEVLQFSRKFPKLESVSGWQVSESHLGEPPVTGQPLDPAYVAQTPLQFVKANRFDPAAPDPPVDHSGGISCYEQAMLNGFTAGFDIYWTKKLGKSASHVELTLFANYGVGIRIPWEAKVTVEPKLITEVRPDQSPFTSDLSIHTHDADHDFYREAGLAEWDVFDGKELLLQGGVGLAAKVKVLGATVLDRPMSNPLVGGAVDMSTHFDPPMNGSSVNLIGPIFPYEVTHLAYDGWILAVGTDLKIDAGIIGNGFDLNVAPHNAWNDLGGGGISKSSRSIFVAQENTPESLPFAVDDDSPKNMTFGGDHWYRHGAVYSEGVYDTDISVTPHARLRGKIKFSAISRFLNDWNISTPFVPIFHAEFNAPDLRRHAGTEGTIEAYHLNRRELGPAPAGTVVHGLAHNGQNTWTVSLMPDCEANIGQISEVLAPGENVVAGSIVGGGVYDPATHTIVWSFTNGAPPQISYQLAGPSSVRPKPLATWTPAGLTEVQTVLQAGGTNLTATQDALLLREYSQRPTIQELIDGRPGSTLLEVDSQNRVRLYFQLDSSEDLHQWTTVQDTVANPLKVEFQLPAGKRFFRFRAE